MKLFVAGPRRVLAAGAGLLALLSVGAHAATPGAGVVVSGARPLRRLAADARAIVLGDVTRSESYDEDRLQVHRLRILRVLRGQIPEGEAGIVEFRAGTAPPLLTPNSRVVALLRPAPRQTYFVQHLPEGDYWEVIGGRDGVLPISGDAELAAVERVLADGDTIASLDAAAVPPAVRRLAFQEVGSGSPRLAADALAELRGLDRVAPLSPEEVEVLGRALRDRRIAPDVRIGLIELVAAQRAREAAPALRDAAADTPAVLDALLAARAELGVSGREQLSRYLEDKDPAVRAAAVRALALLGDPASIQEAGRFATTDPDVSVRTAAVDGLGASKRAEAVPILSRTFESPEPVLKQHSARAMMTIGGPAADEALVNLALRGGSPETRRYATVALVATHGRDHATVRRIEQSNPPADVRDLLEHGFKAPD